MVGGLVIDIVETFETKGKLLNSTVYFNQSNAAFTPDTCSPDTSCIHLYPLSPSTTLHVSCINDKIVVTVIHVSTLSASRTLLRTCIRRHVLLLLLLLLKEYFLSAVQLKKLLEHFTEVKQ